jgi:hypothetical protein
VEIIDDAFAESALLVERAAFSQRQLGEDQVFPGGAGRMGTLPDAQA